jgi:hypothetical protein
MSKFTIIILSLILGSLAFSEEVPQGDAGKLPDADQAMIDKAINSNLGDADKAYRAYQITLTKAQSKVLASLEKLKADANNVHKGNMDLKERSAMVDAIEAKEKEINEGALGDVIAKADDDLSVDKEKDLENLKVAIIGKWTTNNVIRWEFLKDGTGTHYGAGDLKKYPITWNVVNGEIVCSGVGDRHIVFSKDLKTATEDKSISLSKSEAK